MKKFVLLLAGGSGKRMQSDTPKQFLELAGKPLLMHTFEAFRFMDGLEFVLVLSRQDIPQWQQLCEQFHFNIIHQIAEGGPARFHSVKSGLKCIPDDSLVAIHDGVRPLVSREVIRQCFFMAGKKGNAIPAIPLNESIRKVSGAFNQALQREDYRIIQTPQVFQASLIKEAYKQVFDTSFTDDATVLEQNGHTIQLLEGNPENIKITHPRDLAFAEGYFRI